MCQQRLAALALQVAPAIAEGVGAGCYSSRGDQEVADGCVWDPAVAAASHCTYEGVRDALVMRVSWAIMQCRASCRRQLRHNTGV